MLWTLLGRLELPSVLIWKLYIKGDLLAKENSGWSFKTKTRDGDGLGGTFASRRPHRGSVRPQVATPGYPSRAAACRVVLGLDVSSAFSPAAVSKKPPILNHSSPDQLTRLSSVATGFPP